MKSKFRLYPRHNGYWYCEDIETGEQESLRTKDRETARSLLNTKNEAHRQPHLNLQLARTYLSACDPDIVTRTWQDEMDMILKGQTGSSLRRWKYAAQDKAFDAIRHQPILQTTADDLLNVMGEGGVATNVYLRRVHNYALDMNWLPWPIVPRKKWPKVVYGEKRAITKEEHCRIVEREKNPERLAFYELAWHIGASQSDLAHLHAEDIDWVNRWISFERMKTRWRRQQPPIVQFGRKCERLLRRLPQSGPLFPYLIRVRAGDRATEFKQRCVGLGIVGVSLQSYRYAWSERGRKCGYPERFAQQALGHNSKAVHRAHSRRAQVIVPPLEDYEDAFACGKIIPMDLQMGKAAEPVPKARRSSRR